MTEDDPDFNPIEDAIMTVYSLREGHVVTAADVAAIKLYDKNSREDNETATDAFSRGYEHGLARGAGADTAKLIEERDAARTNAMIARALGEASSIFGFARGARTCREMMARFVEQGGDALTAASIRANWNPKWGDDRPLNDEDYEENMGRATTPKDSPHVD